MNSFPIEPFQQNSSFTRRFIYFFCPKRFGFLRISRPTIKSLITFRSIPKTNKIHIFVSCYFFAIKTSFQFGFLRIEFWDEKNNNQWFQESQEMNRFVSCCSCRWIVWWARIERMINETTENYSILMIQEKMSKFLIQNKIEPNSNIELRLKSWNIRG